MRSVMIIESKHEKQTANIDENILLAVLNNSTLVSLFARFGYGKRDRSLEGKSLLFLGVISLLWLILRTGTKPTRIVYPCQRVAVDNVSTSLSTLVPLAVAPTMMHFKRPSFTHAMKEAKSFLSRRWKVILALAIIVPTAAFSAVILLGNMSPMEPNVLPGDVSLTLEAQDATTTPASNIFVTNGRIYSHISGLINLMGSNGLRFYRSTTSGANQGSNGLIASNDVVIIKVNSQWPQRGGTNTDLLRELIEAIIAHPDEFVGEIVVADNGQGRGSLDFADNNAEDHDQSVQDVVDMFSPTHHVSTFNWQTIRGIQVDEYSEGDLNNGYILYDTADPETGIFVTYPKFQTVYGTFISFRDGIWNGNYYENRLRVINMPVLKSHIRYGVTAAVKHYMGVQSEGTPPGMSGGLGNGHNTVATGGMGTLMVECGTPTLNILDAIWINAHPGISMPPAGPSTSYSYASRVNVIMASTDPIALDYWAARHVLMQAASLAGYSANLHYIDPDSTLSSGLTEAFGVWLTLSRDELNRRGYSVTNNENRMNVYISQAGISSAISNPSPEPIVHYAKYDFQPVSQVSLPIQCHVKSRPTLEVYIIDEVPHTSLTMRL